MEIMCIVQGFSLYCQYTDDSVFSGLCVKRISVLSGQLPGPGKTCLYFNILLSVISEHLSYVDNRKLFSNFVQDSLSKWNFFKNLNNLG